MTDSQPRVHLVVGMPRGGTTFLVRRLQQHPDVMAFGESRYFGNDWLEPVDGRGYSDEQLAEVERRIRANPLNSNLPRPGDRRDRAGWIDHIDSDEADARLAAVFDGLSGPVSPGRLFVELCAALAAGSGASTVIEKTPHHVRHLGRIFEQLPHAKALIVVRDPYDFLLSYKHAGDRRSEERRATDEILWQATGVSLLWRSYHRAAVAAAASFGERVKIVKLEDIHGEPGPQLAQVLSFFELAPHDVLADAPERDNSSFAGDRPELTPRDIACFNAVAAGEAKRGGYEVRESNLGPLSRGLAVAGVVPWALRNVRSAARRTDGGLWRYARTAVLRR